VEDTAGDSSQTLIPCRVLMPFHSSLASSSGSPTIFEKLNSWRTQARIVGNEREPRKSQELNMKSDELRDLAFQQTR
jgi:hypothetical protein